MDEYSPAVCFETNSDVIKARLQYILPKLEKDIKELEKAKKISNKSMEEMFVI